MAKLDRILAIEQALPSVQSIIEEYKKQGKDLTVEEAEGIRETIRKNLERRYIKAKDADLGDEELEDMAAGVVSKSSLPVSAKVTYTKKMDVSKLNRPM